NVNVGGEIKKKYQNRRNITYREALHYSKLMEGNAREVGLKSFGYEGKGQAVYNGTKTRPSLLIVGTNRSFLTANAYTLGYDRKHRDASLLRGDLQPDIGQSHQCDAYCARAACQPGKRFRDLFERFTQKRVHIGRWHRPHRRVRRQFYRAPCCGNRDYEYYAGERHRTDEGNWRAQIDRRPQSRHFAAISHRSSLHLGSWRHPWNSSWSYRRRFARHLAESGCYLPIRLGDSWSSRLLCNRHR